MPDPESITRSSVLVDFRNHKLSRKFELSDLRRKRSHRRSWSRGKDCPVVVMYISLIHGFLNTWSRVHSWLHGVSTRFVFAVGVSSVGLRLIWRVGSLIIHRVGRVVVPFIPLSTSRMIIVGRMRGRATSHLLWRVGMIERVRCSAYARGWETLPSWCRSNDGRRGKGNFPS